MQTPKEIVASLDRYIVGQYEAKRAVAIALRNRYRRSRLLEEIREEITPKNIIMIQESVKPRLQEGSQSLLMRLLSKSKRRNLRKSVTSAGM